MADLRGDLLATLSGWRAPSPDQDALRHAFHGFVLAREDALRRTCLPGHVTASAVVLDRELTRVALVHHRIARLWLVPGGHLEPGDATLADAAAREVREETGLELDMHPSPVELSCHPFTCRGSGPTRHYDVCFAGVLRADRPLAVSDESLDLRWWLVDALPSPLGARMPRTIARALDVLNRIG